MTGLMVLSACSEAAAEGLSSLAVDRSMPFSAVLPQAPVPVEAARKPGGLFDGRTAASPAGGPARDLPDFSAAGMPPKGVAPAPVAEAPQAPDPGLGSATQSARAVSSGGTALNLSLPEGGAAGGVLASEFEASQANARRLQKSPRVERLRRILGADVLALPRPPAKGGVPFSAKLIERLGIEDAASAAISQSYQLAAAESRVAYGEAQVGVARAALLPQVKLTVKQGREKTSPGNDTYKYAKNDIVDNNGAVIYRKGDKVPSSSVLNGGVDASQLTSEAFAYDSILLDRVERTLTASQSLFDYAAWGELARQRKVSQSNEYAARGARLKAVLDSSSSYLKLFQNTLSARFAEDYERALQSLFDRMEERVAAGAGSQADLERVRGRRVNARSTVLDARNALEVELTAFQKLTGFRPGALALPPDWILPVPEDVEAAVQAASQANPALMADLKQAEAILMELRKAKGGFLPSVSLEFSDATSRGTAGSRVPIVTSDGTGTFDAGGNLVTGTENHLNKRIQSLMVVLNWNLFNGGQDVYQNIAIGEKYNEAMFRLLDTRREIEEKLRASFESLATTAARTQEIAKEMEANQQVVETFTDQMFVANRSLLDVLDAHQKLYQSRLDYLRLMIAEANLSYDVLYNIGSLTEALHVPASAQSPRGLMGSLVGQDVWRK